MKTFFKKLLKTVLIFILSAIILYCALTGIAFYRWCTNNQINLFDSNYGEDIFAHLDSDKIQELGDSIGGFAELMKDGLNESPYANDGEVHSINDGHSHLIAEFYDPLGYSIWVHLQSALNEIFTKYILISFLLGAAIAIAYAVITSKKVNIILKVVIGYIAIILLVPQILMFSITHNLYFATNLSAVYFNSGLTYFYIGYTILFILMYVINYIIGKKMTKELNETIQETNK